MSNLKRVIDKFYFFQSKRFQETGQSSSADVEFSSPYRVKIVKEIEEQRCEEVDLDTGRRRQSCNEDSSNILAEAL